MSPAPAPAATRFVLPEGLEASAPPEARGLERDEVRMLVARPGRLQHLRFRDLVDQLDPGDLVVFNTSATLPAAVDGVRSDARSVVIHFSAPVEPGTWVVELRGADGPLRDARTGETIRLPSGGRLRILAADPLTRDGHNRLRRAWVRVDGGVGSFLRRHGRPIAYNYSGGPWPLADYQTIFGRHPGSAEMPSAGRPFTHRLVIDLLARGVMFAPVTLHTGVSSLEADETPQDERFEVSPSTARLVNQTRAAGGRIVAVGTTVTRALEAAARPDGTVAAQSGVTDLLLSSARPAFVTDGLITGWHAPRATHLSLLEAVAGSELVQEAYDAAVDRSYLWHEFGDSCLLLPDTSRSEARISVVRPATTSALL